MQETKYQHGHKNNTPSNITFLTFFATLGLQISQETIASHHITSHGANSQEDKDSVVRVEAKPREE